MEASAGLVAGSHNRNELVVIRRDGDPGPKPLRQQNGQVCQICGDDVGLTPDGEPFVACNECAFPVCRDCYEYERREGTQNCPQCKTRFKRLKGCARVPGDEEEDGVDDLENEFNWRDRTDSQYVAESMLHAHMSYGRGGADLNGMPQPFQPIPNVPLLTNGQMVDDIPPEQHALVPSFMGGGGKRIHPLPYADPNLPVQPRSMDPSKDLAAYGYGSVAWKERMESWKQKQERLHQMRNDGSGKDWDGDGDDADLPLMDEARQPLSRKIPIPSSQINPYRMVIIIRLVVLGFFFHYRVMHPVPDAFALWLISVICEIWFAMSWILDQFPKWFPIERETYLDRLTLSASPASLLKEAIHVISCGYEDKTDWGKELCSRVPLQRYTKALSTLQRSSLVEKSRQKPQERMPVLSDVLRRSNYDSEPMLKACGISIAQSFTQIGGRVLQAPKLKAGNGEDIFTRNGRWNFNNKDLT